MPREREASTLPDAHKVASEEDVKRYNELRALLSANPSERNRRIVEEREAGALIREIATRYGITGARVQQILKRAKARS